MVLKSKRDTGYIACRQFEYKLRWCPGGVNTDSTSRPLVLPHPGGIYSLLWRHMDEYVPSTRKTPAYMAATAATDTAKNAVRGENMI